MISLPVSNLSVAEKLSRSPNIDNINNRKMMENKNNLFENIKPPIIFYLIFILLIDS